MTHRFRESKSTRIVVALMAAAVFLLSLGLTAFCTSRDCKSSLDAFLLGGLGLLAGGAISWLANPLFLIALVLTFKGNRKAWLFSGAAMLLCFSFLLVKRVLEDEAGNYGEIISYQMGYWLWCSSTVLLLLGNIVFRKASVVTRDQV